MTAPAKHSRRDVLKKSAVAGAVFWAVPVIESVTARAAAASNCLNNATFSSSYVWVFFSVTSGNTTSYYFTGVKNDGTFSQGASNPACLPCTNSSTSVTTYYSIPNISGNSGGTPSAYSSLISCADATAGPTATTTTFQYAGTAFTSSVNINNYLQVSKSGSSFTVATVPNSGANLLIVFIGPKMTAVCGNGTQPFCGVFA